MPFLAGFSKRKPIRYGTVKPASNQTAFSLLVKASSDADIGAELSTRKLAVTLADGTTQVGYGALKFASAGGLADLALRAKVDLDSSAATNDVLGYLYYDATATDQQNKAVAVDSNTQGYWPLEEDPSGSAPQVLDWTSNASHGTSQGSMTSGDLVAGQVGYGLEFDGTDDYLSVPSFALPTSAITFSCWWKPTVAVSDNDFILFRIFDLTGNTRVYDVFPRFKDDPSNSGYYGWYNNGVEGRLVTDLSGYFAQNTWCHLVHTYDGTTNRVYINGVERGSNTPGVDATWDTSTADDLRFGSTGQEPVVNFPRLVLDEARLDNVARSADWVAYDYQNQFNNGNTVTLGAEEVESDPRRAQLSFVELEVPNGPRRARLAFTELEVPNGPRRARLSFAELEVGNAPRRARLSFVELEVPNGLRRARLSFVELQVPNGPRRARLSFVELQVPDVGDIGDKLFGQLSSSPRLGGTITTQARLLGELSVSC